MGHFVLPCCHAPSLASLTEGFYDLIPRALLHSTGDGDDSALGGITRTSEAPALAEASQTHTSITKADAPRGITAMELELMVRGHIYPH